MRHSAARRSLPLLALLLAWPAPASAQDLPLGPGPAWGRFRGPEGRGLYRDRAPLPAACEPGTQAWSAPSPPGASSPVVAGGRVFLTAAQGGRLLTLAHDLESGALLWQRSLPAGPAEPRIHETHGPASATPTSDGRRVVCSFGSFGLVAYDLEGQELWRRPLPTPKNTFGSAASPVLAQGGLVHLRDEGEGSYLEVLEPATGEPRWRVARPDAGSGWSTPSLRRTESGPEVLAYGTGWLRAYALADGAERWSVPGLTDEPIVVPQSADGLVFVTSYNMNVNPEVEGLPDFAALLEAHDRDGSGDLDQEEAAANRSILSRHDADGEGDHPLSIFFRWLDADRDGRLEADEYPKVQAWLASMEHKNALLALRPAADGRSAELAWQWPRGVPECPSPLVHQGRVVLVKNGGLVTCLRAADGELLYDGRLGQRGPCYASPVAGDGNLYSASARGQVTVFAAGDELRVLSRSDLGERILATPALAAGRVLVRTETRLLAFGAPPTHEER